MKQNLESPKPSLNVPRKLKSYFFNIPLIRKVVIIYILTIFIPTLFLFTYFYVNNMNEVKQSYLKSQKSIIFQAEENLNFQLQQIASTTYLFQQSNTLLDLLNNDAYLSDVLFYYIRDVAPLITTAKSNTYVKSIHIYSLKELPLNMESEGLASISVLDRDPEFIDTILKDMDFWELTYHDQFPDLRYYKVIYSNTFPYYRGILRYDIDFPALTENFFQQTSCPLFFFLQDGTILGYENQQFHIYTSEPEALHEKTMQITLTPFSDSTSLVIPITPMQAVQLQGSMILVSLFIMGSIFTAFYIMMNYSVVNRLNTFAKHIEQSNAEQLAPFPTEGYQDEVGIVINSYNKLVVKSNNLINKNLMIQIQKQNSDYYALQAQIHPHFLYNILENIRMNAEANHDLDTADMLLALGRHMRYTLNMSSQPLALEDELYFSRNYLQIHKFRMRKKIQFQILLSTEIDDVFCPRFLLQPLLENAIKHGYNLTRPLHILISVENAENPNFVRVTLEDDGNGIPKEKLEALQLQLKNKELEKSQHVGLLNVNSRLASFLQEKDSYIHIDSQENQGTKLVFDLKRKEKKSL